MSETTYPTAHEPAAPCLAELLPQGLAPITAADVRQYVDALHAVINDCAGRLVAERELRTTVVAAAALVLDERRWELNSGDMPHREDMEALHRAVTAQADPQAEDLRAGAIMALVDAALALHEDRLYRTVGCFYTGDEAAVRLSRAVREYKETEGRGARRHGEAMG